MGCLACPPRQSPSMHAQCQQLHVWHIHHRGNIDPNTSRKHAFFPRSARARTGLSTITLLVGPPVWEQLKGSCPRQMLYPQPMPHLLQLPHATCFRDHVMCPCNPFLLPGAVRPTEPAEALGLRASHNSDDPRIRIHVPLPCCAAIWAGWSSASALWLTGSPACS